MNYKNIASKYDQRYESGQLRNVGRFLVDVIKHNHFKEVIEVGCGTGHWLNSIQTICNSYGCDLSLDMLKVAQKKNLMNLVLSNAQKLSFKPQSFDFLFLVNAFHHFDDKINFLFESFSLLKNNGALAIVCVDPANKDDNWYVYDYFDGVFEKDLIRFPRWDEIKSWMNQIGFRNVVDIEVEIVCKKMINNEVFQDKFLLKHNSSQLAGLSDDIYNLGCEKIKHKIQLSLTNKTKIEFVTNITYKVVMGFK